ncbi:MAG: MarR family winged helix-turn-helix transcriptional regulator [Clostridia bacterium]|nr:MarR family winged helix-turn-helix transcriptional regulator [Clostridia bacterium]
MSPTPDPTSPETGQSALTETMRLFLRVGRIHRSAVERRVADLGIHHSQHRMLMYLSRHDATPSQRELADVMGISPAAVTSTLKCLEKEGYITRAVTEEDNRRNRVSITEKGQLKVDESRSIFDSMDHAAFAGFSERELAEFRDLLMRMCQNLAIDLALGDSAAPPSGTGRTE